MPVRITAPDARQIQRSLPGLPSTGVAEVADTARAITYSDGETIMGAGQSWFPAVVADGMVRFTIRSRDGREATLRVMGKGSLVGLSGVFAARAALPTTERMLVATERATLITFDPVIFMRLGQQHSEFCMHLVNVLTQAAADLTDAAGRFAFLTVRERVAAHLLGVAASDTQDGAEPAAAITQQQLADAVGSVREVVARTVRDLRAEGVIRPQRGRIEILNRRRLAEIASVT